MKFSLHERAEVLAGAIALGEATDAERIEYRGHLATCGECLQRFGGEHELARTAAVVSDARSAEIWEPDLRSAVVRAMTTRKRWARLGLSALGICFAMAFFVRVLVVSGFAHLTPSLAAPVVLNYGSTRIVLESRAPVVTAKSTPAARRLLVMHNVVQLSRAGIAPPHLRAPVAPRTGKASAPQEIAQVTVHPAPVAGDHQNSGVPPWRRDGASWTTVAKMTTTSLSESAPQNIAHAESIEIAAVYSTREATPLGGETAINPRPPMIAYDEGAEGTAVFEVRIDERGVPQKCVITRSSGYEVLDESVCKAAMQAHYTPKTVSGQAVPGVYRDAFTFQMRENPSL